MKKQRKFFIIFAPSAETLKRLDPKNAAFAEPLVLDLLSINFKLKSETVKRNTAKMAVFFDYDGFFDLSFVKIVSIR